MEEKCVSCIGEYITARDARQEAQATGAPYDGSEPLPEISDAITLAPSWQSRQLGMQVVYACVALPTCMRHLGLERKSSLAAAVAGGRLLNGRIEEPSDV
jgi:hypothetical protein